MTATVPIADLPNVSLPQASYLSGDVLAEEMDRIFARTWRFVGHVAEWPTAGSFRRVRVGRHDVLVVRDNDGAIHGLRNTCRHRGSVLLTEETGHCGRTVTCSYHGWAYGYDGALKGAPRMGADFDTSPYSLGTVPVEVWNGLVFACVGGDPRASVAETLKTVEFPYAGLAEASVGKRSQRIVEANWKVCWENGLECYHCAINHPGLATVADINADGGYYDDDVPDEEFNYYDFPLMPGMETVTPDGRLGCTKPFGAPQADPVKFMSWHGAVFELIFTPDHVAIMTYLPIAPTRTQIDTLYLVRGDAVAGEDYDPETFFLAHINTRDEDDVVCERVQTGLNAVGYVPGPFNEYFEMENRRFLHWYQRAMSS